MKPVAEIVAALQKPIKKYTLNVRGKSYPYVKGTDVITRLNDAFDYQWSSEVVSAEEKHGFVLACVRLNVIIDGVRVTHTGFGSAPIMKHRNSEEIVDLGNNYKSAYTNALKKAAEQFGIGLSDEGEDSIPADSGSLVPQKTFTPRNKYTPQSTQSDNKPSTGILRPRPTPIGKNTSTSASAPKAKIPAPAIKVEDKTQGDLATDMQVSALKSMLTRFLGSSMSEAAVIKKAVPTSDKVDFKDLTRSEAAVVITTINTLARESK